MNKRAFATFIILPLTLTIGTLANGATQKTSSVEKLLKEIKQTVVESRPDPKLLNASQCVADENQYTEIQRQLLDPWISSWQQQDVDAYYNLLDGKFSSARFVDELSGSNKSNSLGSVTKYSWSPEMVRQLKDPAKIRQMLKDYVTHFSKIEDIELKTIKFVSPRSMRKANGDMEQAELHVLFDLRGFEGKNKRQDRGTLKVLVNKGESNWKITGLEVMKMDTLKSGSTPSFVDVTSEFGLASLPRYVRTEAIRRGGYALAVGDINNDGFLDMFVGNLEKSELHLGDANGKFLQLKASGLANETFVKTAVFADFDNDGFQDLLLTRFAPKKNRNNKINDLVLYKNIGGKSFRQVAGVKDNANTNFVMPAAVADFNRDGFLDFYIGFPGKKDFTYLAEVKLPQAVEVQRVYLNNKEMSFLPTKDKAFSNSSAKDANLQNIFPHSAIAMDYDQDGDADILVVDDRGNISPLYQNKGDGTFAETGESAGIHNRGFGMGAAVGDLNGDGLVDIAVTNVDFASDYRLHQSCKANWNMDFKGPAFDSSGSIKMFKGMGGGKFADTSKVTNLDWPGEGLGGVEFVDYNNDGRLDIYVTNGLWTGTDKTQDLSSYFSTLLAKNFTGERALGEINVGTKSNFMSVLSDFKGDLVSLKAGNSRPHMGGNQRNRLYRNNGDNTFTDVAFLEGVDSIADGYVVAVADVNRDGKMELILRNADRGTLDVSYPPVQIFKNVNQEGHKSLLVRLVGKTSNHDAIGAEVTAVIAGTKVVRQLIANNGAAQSERVLHFGMGTAEKVSKLTVKWPNGGVQTLENLEPGVLTITENTRMQAQQ
jgi:hypothetical protein